jgi:O-antigen ligase
LIFTGIFLWVLSLAILRDRYELLVLPFVLVFLYASWTRRETVFFLLIAAIPFSIEYRFSPMLGTDIPDEFLMMWVSCLFFGYWLYKPSAVSFKLLRHPLVILLLASIFWAMVSLLFSTDPLISLKFFLAKGWYIGAFVLAPLIVFQDKRMLMTTLKILAAAVSIVVLVSLMRHAQLAFRFSSVNKSLFPFFRNHVNYAAMLVCVVPVLLFLFKVTERKITRIIIIAAISIAITGLFFSYSRGAWLALPAGLFAVWLIRRKWMVKTFIFLVVFALGSLAWLVKDNSYLKYTHDFRTTIYHRDFREHLIATYKLKDVSTAERFYRWIAGVRMIKDNPLTGYGPNTFYDNYKPYTVPAFKTWVSENKEHSTVHNYFLLLAIEQGIPALVLFLFLLGALFWYAQRVYHRATDKFYKNLAMLSGMMTAMIMIVIFLSDLIETDKIGSLFFLNIAMLIVADINSGRKPAA